MMEAAGRLISFSEIFGLEVMLEAMALLMCFIGFLSDCLFLCVLPLYYVELHSVASACDSIQKPSSASFDQAIAFVKLRCFFHGNKVNRSNIDNSPLSSFIYACRIRIIAYIL